MAKKNESGKLASFFAVLAHFHFLPGSFWPGVVRDGATHERNRHPKSNGRVVANLWQLLSKDFVLLVVISLFIAFPVTWYFMQDWIQRYTYHTDVSWWVFAASGAGALLITLLTVSFQSIKAA